MGRFCRELEMPCSAVLEYGRQCALSASGQVYEPVKGAVGVSMMDPFVVQKVQNTMHKTNSSLWRGETWSQEHVYVYGGRAGRTAQSRGEYGSFDCSKCRLVSRQQVRLHAAHQGCQFFIFPGMLAIAHNAPSKLRAHRGSWRIAWIEVVTGEGITGHGSGHCTQHQGTSRTCIDSHYFSPSREFPSSHPSRSHPSSRVQYPSQALPASGSP